MTSARDTILGRIGQRLDGSRAPGRDKEAVAQRLSGHPRNLLPERSTGLSGEALTGRFLEWAKFAAVSVDRLDSMADVAKAAAAYLASRNLPAAIVTTEDPLLDGVDWTSAPTLQVKIGKSDGSDAVSLTPAYSGIAETGTLMLVSGETRATNLNFLPETHVVVLKESQLVNGYEDAWDRLRAEYGEGVMPRTVNFITGPSRTGDIEQKIEMGAHGPKALHILLVKG